MRTEQSAQRNLSIQFMDEERNEKKRKKTKRCLQENMLHFDGLVVHCPPVSKFNS